MNDHEVQTAEKQPPSLWKRLLIGAGVFLLLLAALAVSGYALHRGQVGRSLKDAVAHLDETDPGWRLEDLEAARPQVPDAENSALVVLAAHKFIPKGRPDNKVIERIDAVGDLLPHRLSAENLTLLEGELRVLQPAVLEARRLAEMPRGRHRLVLDENPVLTLLPHVQQTREVATLLKYDALRLSQQGRHSEALRSCRAIVNAGRSMSDEPFMISQLVRMAVLAVGCQTAEKTLALGEPSVAELIQLQQLLEEEGKHPTLRAALRGERAMMHQLFQGLSAGRFDLRDLGEPMGSAYSSRFLMPFLGWLTREVARREHPRMLELMSQAVENTRLPEHEQEAAESALEMEVKKAVQSPTLLRMLMPSMSKFALAGRRNTAASRCLIALLAVERYHRDQGDWPAKLEELTPKYLAAVPLDPFDGKPLRFLRTPDGVIVYSVGQNGKDDGGQIRRTATMTTPPPDVGFQLWNKALRGQPPRPAGAPKPPGKGPGDPP